MIAITVIIMMAVIVTIRLKPLIYRPPFVLWMIAITVIIMMAVIVSIQLMLLIKFLYHAPAVLILPCIKFMPFKPV